MSCGGGDRCECCVVDALLRAPADDDDWALTVDEERTGIDAVTVELVNFVEPEPYADDSYEYETLSDDIEDSDEGDEAGEGAPALGWPPALAVEESDGASRFTELDGWDRAVADLPGTSQGESTGWD